MSGECNYCGGAHAEGICNADREIVYQNGSSFGYANAMNERIEEVASLRTQLAEANARAERHKALADHMIENEAACRKALQAFDKSDGHATESIVELATAAVARIDRLRAECAAWRRWDDEFAGEWDDIAGRIEGLEVVKACRAACDAHGDLDQNPHAEGAD